MRNFDVGQLCEAERASSGARIACNQVLYHLGDRSIERRLIPYCVERGIAVVGDSPFGQHRFPSLRTPGGRALDEGALNFLARRAFLIPKSGFRRTCAKTPPRMVGSFPPRK